MTKSETNITGDVHGDVYSGNIGQIGDIHINTGGGNYYEGGEHHHYPGPTWPLYINIPAPPTHFLGREDLLTRLITQLCAGTTTFSADGLPGVGKTTLAVMIAHHEQIRAHFTDGVLWAGLGPNGDPALALSRWADALKLDLSGKPTTAARAAAVADAISGRKLLIVLDDIWQLEHAQTLRLGGPASVHLLTTRDQRIAAAFGHVATIDVLTPKAARELFRVLAPAAYNADPAAADALLESVGYLPLAIELLAGYLNAGASKRFAVRTRQALHELTTPQHRLSLAAERLGSHGSAAVTLEQTIALSLEGLAEEDETAVAVFHALGAFAPKPATFDIEAAAAVTGATEDTLALLADRNLLEIGQDESLALHQTLADAARAQAPAEAITQHRNHYLLRVDADQEDWRRISKIYPQIIHAWRHTPQNDTTNLTFVDSLSTYQTRQGFWQDRLSWLDRAQQVAKLTNDPSSEARMLNNAGYAYDAIGEKQQALHYYEQALPLCRAVGDHTGEARTLTNIGAVYGDLGEKQAALRYYEQALPLCRAAGDRNGEAATLNNIGQVHGDLGDKQAALRYYEQSLPLSRAVGDRAGEATTLTNIGLVYAALGEQHEALRYYEQSLPLRRSVGDRTGEAATLNNIGMVYDELGEKQEALRYYEQSLLLRRAVGDRAGEAATLNNIARFYSALGEKQESLRYYEQSLHLFRSVGDCAGEAGILNNIGFVYAAFGEQQAALRYYEQSLPLFRSVGDPAGEAGILNNMGAIYFQEGELGKVIDLLEQVIDIDRQIGAAPDEALHLCNLAIVQSQANELDAAIANLEKSIAILNRLNLNQDAAGQTRQQHEALLSQIKARRAQQ